MYKWLWGLGSLHVGMRILSFLSVIYIAFRIRVSKGICKSPFRLQLASIMSRFLKLRLSQIDIAVMGAYLAEQLINKGKFLNRTFQNSENSTCSCSALMNHYIVFKMSFSR